MSMTEVANKVNVVEPCQRNKFSEIEIAIKCNTKIKYILWWCDAMPMDGYKEETSKFATLSGCTYNNAIYYVFIEPRSICVTYPCKKMISVCSRQKYVHFSRPVLVLF